MISLLFPPSLLLIVLYHSEARITLALNVITRTGVAQPHHIEFVHTNDSDELMFPPEYEFTVEAAPVPQAIL